MAPDPTFAQSRGSTLANALILALMTSVLFVFSPTAGLILAAPLFYVGGQAAAWVGGVAGTLMMWGLIIQRCRVEGAGRITLRPAWFELGPAWWPVRVPYDRVASLRIADALGTLPVAGAPMRGPGATLHIAGRGVAKRLVLGDDALPCADALLARCPRAVLVDGGLERAAGGSWTQAHRDTAVAHYRKQARQHGAFAAVLAVLGLGGVVALLAGEAGGSAVGILAPAAAVGASAVRAWRRAGTVPAAPHDAPTNRTASPRTR